MPFGLMSAVLQLNRVSTFLVALARRWFALPILGFYDGFEIFELGRSGKKTRRTLVTEVVSGLGFHLDPNENNKTAHAR